MMINSQKVFVDTSAWIALINSSDNLAAKAKQILVRLKPTADYFSNNRVCFFRSG